MYIFYVSYVFSLVFDLLEVMYYLIKICYYNFFFTRPHETTYFRLPSICLINVNLYCY